MQKKLANGSLLNEEGSLTQAGWSTKLIKTYDPAQIKASKWRIKGSHLFNLGWGNL